MNLDGILYTLDGDNPTVMLVTSPPHEVALFGHGYAVQLRRLNDLKHSPPPALGFVGLYLTQLSFHEYKNFFNCINNSE
jgi:hypothetical protein